VDSNLSWIRNYNIDGFYINNAASLPISFWRLLNVKMRTQFMVPQKRSLYMFGNVEGNRLTENNYLTNGLLYGVIDKTFCNDMAAVLSDTGKSFETLSTTAFESGLNFGFQNTMCIASEDYITKGKEAMELHNLAEAIKLGMPGVPMIKYGEECGANLKAKDGPVDMANLSKAEMDALEKFKKLANARLTNIAGLLGETQYNVFDDKVLGISRTYFDHGMVTLVNKSNQPQSVTFNIDNFPYVDVDFKPTTLFGSKPVINVYIEKIQTVTIDLPPYGIEVLQY
jgi:glycosidase